jgi:hypothetical protein
LIGIVIVVAAGFWLLGGVFLRVVGIVFALSGVLSLILLGDPFGVIAMMIGLVMWLAGHWHYAFRHHGYKSPLAQRIFLQVLPRRYDPTQGWGMPIIPEKSSLSDSEGASDREAEASNRSWS